MGLGVTKEVIQVGAVKEEFIIICSWCNRQRKRGAESKDPDAWMEPEDVPEDELAASTGQHISHGICPDCLAIECAKVDTWGQAQDPVGRNLCHRPAKKGAITR